MPFIEVAPRLTRDQYIRMGSSPEERYPTWDEIKSARDQLLPKNKDYMMILPRPALYVNIHPNCFHLWETPKGWNVL